MRRYFLYSFAPLGIVSILTLSALGQDGASSIATNPNPTSAPAPATSGQLALTAGNYLLRSNDLVRITVFQEDDLTTEARIPNSGSIMFPLLGSVPLQGKSVADAQELIRSLLAKKYIKNPHVTVTVLDYSKLWVSLLGGVQKPGNVEIPVGGGLDLLGAIALSGGYVLDADPAHINIRRTVNGQDVILNVNAMDLAQDPKAKPLMIQPGDVITIPNLKSITVTGEVKSPGKINLPAEGGLDLLGAINAGGGYTQDANPTEVEVRRTVDGQDSILTINAARLAKDSSLKPFMVQAGDTITVKISKQSVTILGEVQKPGQIKIPPEGGLDLLGAAALAGGFTEDADIAHITVRRTIDGKDVIIKVNAKELSHDSTVGNFIVESGDNITVPQRIF